MLRTTQFTVFLFLISRPGWPVRQTAVGAAGARQKKETTSEQRPRMRLSFFIVRLLCCSLTFCLPFVDITMQGYLWYGGVFACSGRPEQGSIYSAAEAVGAKCVMAAAGCSSRASRYGPAVDEALSLPDSRDVQLSRCSWATATCIRGAGVPGRWRRAARGAGAPERRRRVPRGSGACGRQPRVFVEQLYTTSNGNESTPAWYST